MTAVSHLNAVKPFRQCTPWLWSQNLCHVCPGDWHQCLTYMHIPARAAFPTILSLFFFIMKCLIILYSDESKASAKKKNVAFSCSRFLPGKHVVILVFPVKRINQNQVIILIINYPKTVTIT